MTDAGSDEALRERARQSLVRMGLRPQEAEASVSLRQTHLSDWTVRGGLA